MVKFEVGQCYYARSIGDHNCIFAYLVIKRTEKTITLQDDFGEVHRCKVKLDNVAEYCLPKGNYSMAPVLHANSVLPGEGQNVEERKNILRRAAIQEEADNRMSWKTAQQINNMFSIV